MKKVLFYGMTGEKSCFMHVLLNAVDLHGAGHEVKVVFEGASVKLPAVFEGEKNSIYLQAKEAGLLAGICLACSKTLGVFEANQALGLPMLGEMKGHTGVKPFLEAGSEVISI
jgi:hypothetical protein